MKDLLTSFWPSLGPRFRIRTRASASQVNSICPSILALLYHINKEYIKGSLKNVLPNYYYGPKNLTVLRLVVNPSENWGKNQLTVFANAFKLHENICVNFRKSRYKLRSPHINILPHSLGSGPRRDGHLAYSTCPCKFNNKHKFMLTQITIL